MGDKKNINYYAKKAFYCINNEDYEGAIQNINKILKIDNKNIEAYNNRGNCYLRLEQYKEAVNDYSKAIELDDSFIAYYNRGICYYELGEYNKAIEDYSNSIERKIDYINSYRYRAYCYLKLKKYNEAVEDFSKVIELDNRDIDAYFNRGSCYYELKKYDKAIEDCNKIIELNDMNVDAYYNRGICYYESEQYNKAVEDYTKVIELDPNIASAYNNRAVCNLYLHNKQEVIEDFKQAVKYDKDNSIFCQNLLNAYNENPNKYEDEINTLKLQLEEKKFFAYIKDKVENEEDEKMLVALYSSVYKLKRKMLYNDETPVAHYTKIGNLKFLIKPKELTEEKDEKIPKIRLNNVAYMNDPTEGQVFLNMLEEGLNEEFKNEDENIELIRNLYNTGAKSNYGREVFNGKNHTFLVSFSKAIDTSLPMWVQYCDDGKGCCLVFKFNFFDGDEKESFRPSIDSANKAVENEEDKEYYCLYEVKYVNNLGDKKDAEKDNYLKKFIDPIRENVLNCLKKIEEYKDEDRENVIKSIVRDILDQVRYLFKDENYAHEQEVRIIKFENNGKVKYTGDAEGFVVPHVYIDMERKLKVKEVILGPKVTNAMEIASYLAYSGIDIVSKSKIKYK